MGRTDGSRLRPITYSEQSMHYFQPPHIIVPDESANAVRVALPPDHDEAIKHVLRHGYTPIEAPPDCQLLTDTGVPYLWFILNLSTEEAA